MLGDVDDRHAHQLADLRRCDSDAAGKRSHRVEQVLGHPHCLVAVGRTADLLQQRVRVPQYFAYHYRASCSSACSETSTPCSRPTAAIASSSSTPGGSASSRNIT